MARTQSRKVETECCPPEQACTVRPELADRPLLGFAEAGMVVALFRILSSDTRIRILHHIIRCGESSVTDIAKSLEMKPQAVSNQLVRLSDSRMIASRRAGNNVFYRVENGCVAPLLEFALCLMETGTTPQGIEGYDDAQPD